MPRLIVRTLFTALGLLTLSSCTAVDADRNLRAVDTAIFTQVTFEPLTRQRAAEYLESERHVYQTQTEPMKKTLAGLEAGRGERYREVAKDFPECERQRYCGSQLSHTDIKRLERYNQLVKDIQAYDRQIIELRSSLLEWNHRKELRERAIFNRFLVNEVLQIGSVEPRIQKILVYSLENFPNRRMLSEKLLHFAGPSIVPKIYGDYNFRMMGSPVDEAAVIAAYEVYLARDPENPEMPLRYIVTFLVNTQQRDLWHYDRDFLRVWADKLAEPYQKSLRDSIYCGLYSIAADSLAPQFSMRPKTCASIRQYVQSADPAKVLDRMAVEQQMIPLAIYAITAPGELLP